MYKALVKTVKTGVFAVGRLVSGDITVPSTGVAIGSKRQPEHLANREEATSSMPMGQYFLHVIPWIIPWWNMEVRPTRQEAERAENSDTDQGAE